MALQCSEADSQLILGDNNSAARLLSRPGEAIYNDAGGLVEANSPFQISWLPEEQRDIYLKQVIERTRRERIQTPAPIVFEGNAPADLARNHRLATFIEAPAWPASATAPMAWIGEPVAIKDPTSVTFRRQSGSNMIIIGQQEESALAIISAAAVSLASQQAPAGAEFIVMDGTAADSPLAGALGACSAALPHKSRMIEWRAVPETMGELAREMNTRREGETSNAPSIYLMVYGLQRYRMLRRQEESFSLSSSDEEKPPQADKIFADLLREGPALGMHVIVWADTPATIERTFDRNSMREFDNRILFQMSANDSSNLIDSPMANKLGFHRALAYSEEQGVMEKFRPYAMCDGAWLEHLKERLAGRAGGL